MTTIVIDESVHEGRAFIELLRQMKFARVVDETAGDWWTSISPAEQQAIKEGLADIEEGHTVLHEQVKELYGHWL